MSETPVVYGKAKGLLMEIEVLRSQIAMYVRCDLIDSQGKALLERTAAVLRDVTKVLR